MSSSHGTAAASTSNFMSIRQAISGPSPPPSYARLVKAVLRYRQKRVYGLAAAGVAVILPLAAFPVAGFGELQPFAAMRPSAQQNDPTTSPRALYRRLHRPRLPDRVDLCRAWVLRDIARLHRPQAVSFE